MPSPVFNTPTVAAATPIYTAVTTADTPTETFSMNSWKQNPNRAANQAISSQLQTLAPLERSVFAQPTAPVVAPITPTLSAPVPVSVPSIQIAAAPPPVIQSAPAVSAVIAAPHQPQAMMDIPTQTEQRSVSWVKTTAPVSLQEPQVDMTIAQLDETPTVPTVAANTPAVPQALLKPAPARTVSTVQTPRAVTTTVSAPTPHPITTLKTSYKKRWFGVSDPIAPDWSVKPSTQNGATLPSQTIAATSQVFTQQRVQMPAQPVAAVRPIPAPLATTTPQNETIVSRSVISAPTPIPAVQPQIEAIASDPLAQHMQARNNVSIEGITPRVSTPISDLPQHSYENRPQAQRKIVTPISDVASVAQATAAQSQTVAPAAPKPSSAAPIWSARKGDKVRTILSKWAQREGIGFDWQSQDSYSIASSMNIKGNFDSAVSTLMTRGFGANGPLQPVIQVNKITGQKSLVVRDRAI